MMTSYDKVGGWVKKGQNHDDVVILECPLITIDGMDVLKLFQVFHHSVSLSIFLNFFTLCTTY